MVVLKTLVPPAHIAFIKAMPCPVTSTELNLFCEDELAYQPRPRASKTTTAKK
jgi:hypothetical protein